MNRREFVVGVGAAGAAALVPAAAAPALDVLADVSVGEAPVAEFAGFITGLFRVVEMSEVGDLVTVRAVQEVQGSCRSPDGETTWFPAHWEVNYCAQKHVVAGLLEVGDVFSVTGLAP